MTSAATAADRRPGAPSTATFELLVTILLVVAAVATSWSSYQATRWNGEQAKAAGRTSAIRIEAARSAGLAEAQTQIDVATFIAWTAADIGGDPDLAEFYVKRFRDEFRVAFDAWIDTDPLQDRTAPRTPFAMPEYEVAARTEAVALDAKAEKSAASVAEDVQRASNYVLTVVLYTVVLLFAGMSTKLSQRRTRVGMLTIGYVLLLVTVAWVTTFPVSLAV